MIVLDAIVVGMDMLIKKFLLTKRGKIKKRLCLITSALCPTKGPYKGAKEDEIGTIAEQMTAHGIRLECIVARGRLSGNMNMRIMEENDLLLKLFSKKTIAKTVYVESPTSLLGALRTRNVAPVTIFRGDLELSPKMEIKVRFMACYPCTSEVNVIFLFMVDCFITLFPAQKRNFIYSKGD